MKTPLRFQQEDTERTEMFGQRPISTASCLMQSSTEGNKANEGMWTISSWLPSRASVEVSLFARLVVSLLLAVGSVSAATRYVWRGSPSPGPPYTNWATAAVTIQDAVDAAVAGDEIVVTNGVYAAGGKAIHGTTTNRVVVDKPLNLMSVNGPELTVIDGGGLNRCASLASGAVLNGFTLTNGAAYDGGGVRCESINAVVTNCVLTGNSAFQYGGGAYSGTLNNCTLTDNSTRYGGGASGCILNNCTLTGNTARYGGGGAFGGTLSNCTLTANSAESGGGAYDCALYHSRLTSNIAVPDVYGGNGGGAADCTLDNCILTSNSALYGGGGAYQGTLHNSTLTGNTAKYGGGAFESTLHNCTITGNSADGGGGAAGGELNNCIVYFNTTTVGSEDNYRGTNLNYCCITPAPLGGTGNITNAPQMVSASRIATSSPCVGAGSPSYISGVDIDGEPWRSPPSIGADEPYAGSAGELSVAIQAQSATVAVGFQTRLTALTEGPATASSWDFGDGSGPTNRAYTAHAWTAPGTYAVVLTAWNADHPSGVSATAFVWVVTAPVHYVNCANATPAYPYGDWTAAATNVQDAVDAATVPGALVLVTNGVYATGSGIYADNRVRVDKPIVLRSVNGPQATIIEGDFFLRCVYLANDAMLSGFTLTNGFKGVGAGVLGASVSGTVVTNCVLTDNEAYADNTSWYGAYGGGAAYVTLYNCTLIGNVARVRGHGGGAYRCILYNCTLTGNSGFCADRATLNNCTLVGNSGGAFGSTLNNCIVYYSNSSGGSANNYDSCSLNYCCTTPLPTNAVGNITNAPLFVDTNNWADLRLRPDSPCIDTGNNDFVTTLTDLDGNPRIINGIVDMGAYEFVPLTPADLVQQLIDMVNESDLRHKRPLLASLKAVLASIERGDHNSATGQLGAFQNKVRAQVSKKDAALAMELIEGAGQVIVALGGDKADKVAAEIHGLKRGHGGKIKLKFSGTAGQTYIVEASTNLVDWEAVGTATVKADGSFEFEDAEAARHECRFYRIVQP